MSDIGGILGILIGVSAISGMEVLEFLGKILVVFINGDVEEPDAQLQETSSRYLYCEPELEHLGEEDHEEEEMMEYEEDPPENIFEMVTIQGIRVAFPYQSNNVVMVGGGRRISMPEIDC